MSEAWRRKRYYDKRVILSVPRILDPQFEDILVCITGAQVEMLRNMTQYLHRRSTYASAYEPDHYLAPSNEEWDAIQAIVADLEDTLMGCDEITALFEQMVALLECVCDKTTRLALYGEGTDPVVNYYLDDGTMVDRDTHQEDTAVDVDSFFRAYGS